MSGRTMPAAHDPAAPWVLLRGLTREHGHWAGFDARLARAWPAARVLTPDLPGAGVLAAQRSPLQVAAMVAAVRAQVAAAGVAPGTPLHVLGLSLGGMVACAWAQAHPAEVAALALVNTSLRPYSRLTDRLRPAHWPRLLRLLAAHDARQVEAAVLALTSAAPARHTARLADWVAIRQARPVRTGNALRQLVSAALFRHRGPPPPVPTLVLHSEGDGLVHPRCSQALAHAWGVPVRAHPWAGHDLPLDDGPWLVQQLVDWLGPAPAG